MRRAVALRRCRVRGGAGAAAETVRFIACPIYRDTDAGRKSGCWLADERASGTRFDVSRGAVASPTGTTRCWSRAA